MTAGTATGFASSAACPSRDRLPAPPRTLIFARAREDQGALRDWPSVSLRPGYRLIRDVAKVPLRPKRLTLSAADECAFFYVLLERIKRQLVNSVRMLR